MERTEDGKYICQYNKGCECSVPNCDECGWNPKVAERRLREFKEGRMFLIGFLSGCAAALMIEFLAFVILVLKCYKQKMRKTKN